MLSTDVTEVSNIRLVPAAHVDPELRARVDKLVERHRDDLPGLLAPGWARTPAMTTFVVLHVALAEPVGLVAWTGPDYMADPSWWIRPERRCRGYARQAIKLLAGEMVRAGVHRIKDHVLIQVPKGDQRMRQASRKLVVLLHQLVDEANPTYPTTPSS